MDDPLLELQLEVQNIIRFLNGDLKRTLDAVIQHVDTLNRKVASLEVISATGRKIDLSISDDEEESHKS